MYVNIFTEKQVKVWARLDWADDSDIDLVMLQENEVYSLFSSFPFEDEDETYPYGPAWFTRDILAQGLWDIMQPEGDVELLDWARWGIDNGIAPLQPFELIFSHPHYSRSYEGEYDADYPWDIGQISPLHDRVKSYRWDHYFRSIDFKIPELK